MSHSLGHLPHCLQMSDITAVQYVFNRNRLSSFPLSKSLHCPPQFKESLHFRVRQKLEVFCSINHTNEHLSSTCYVLMVYAKGWVCI